MPVSADKRQFRGEIAGIAVFYLQIIKQINQNIGSLDFSFTKFGVKKIRFGVRMILFGIPINYLGYL